MQHDFSKLLAQLQDLDLLWSPLGPAASESAFQELLPEARLLTGNDRSHLAELLTQIGRAQTVQGKVSEARLSLEAAEKLLADPQLACPVSIKIRWLLERGRLYISDKTPSQARVNLVEAWTLAKNSGEDHFVVEIAQMMAIIEPQKHQQEWIAKAIQVAESSPQPKAKRWLGSLFASLGWKLYDLRQFENAFETFQKSLSHLKVHGSAREVFIARWSTGKVLRTMGKTEEALVIQKALLAELGIGGVRDGRLYEELAECLQTLERSTEAQLYFELAYRELSSDEWVTDNQPVKLKRMKELGKVKEKRKVE